MRIERPRYDLIATAFGPVAIVWWEAAVGPRVRHLFLSTEQRPAEKAMRGVYPGAHPAVSPAITDLGDRVRRSLEGEAITFELDILALEVCGEFQRRVLVAEHGIRRGWVSTYGRLAEQVGAKGAGRAVGRALATNPFPILIPCHRAVRADGDLGGYQGGRAMKRALLAMEGVEFTAQGKVAMSRVYYA